MFASAFQNRSVLITGHTGFKGSWLSLWLWHLGADVLGFALDPPQDPNLFSQIALSETITDIRGDIRDAQLLKRVLAEYQPSFIFHLAAQPLVLESYRAPLETFGVNIMGTAILLDAVRTLQLPCTVVAVTTDKVYENREWVYGYREDDPLGGHDPYSASKAAMEVVVASYRRSYFAAIDGQRSDVRLATARSGNVIGAGDWAANRILPDAIRAFASGEALQVRSPHSIRPWQHVLESLSGYLWLAALLAAPGGEELASAWNFGPSPESEATVGTVADLAAAAWTGATWESGRSIGPHEATRLTLNTDKTRTILGWFPVWNLTTAILRTVRSYRGLIESTSQEEARNACFEDIAAYERSAMELGLPWARADVKTEPARQGL